MSFWEAEALSLISSLIWRRSLNRRKASSEIRSWASSLFSEGADGSAVPAAANAEEEVEVVNGGLVRRKNYSIALKSAVNTVVGTGSPEVCKMQTYSMTPVTFSLNRYSVYY